jgi:hypothetical protein
VQTAPLAAGPSSCPRVEPPILRLLALIVFAHAGHWLPQLLYLAPVVVMLVALAVGKVRERRRR